MMMHWSDGWYRYYEAEHRWVREDGKWERTDWDVMTGHPGEAI